MYKMYFMKKSLRHACKRGRIQKAQELFDKMHDAKQFHGLQRVLWKRPLRHVSKLWKCREGTHTRLKMGFGGGKFEMIFVAMVFNHPNFFLFQWGFLWGRFSLPKTTRWEDEKLPLDETKIKIKNGAGGSLLVGT